MSSSVESSRPAARSPQPEMTCPRCSRDSFHAIAQLQVQINTRTMVSFSDEQGSFGVSGEDLTQLRGRNSRDIVWRASVCVSCKQGSVWRGDQLVYPGISQAPSPHPSMPDGARELYEEAALVLPLSRRAAAALARASLERLLRSLPNADSKARLDDLIASLSSRVSHRLWQTLTALRYLGNSSLHEDTQSELVTLYLEGDAAEVVEPVFGAINAIVEEVIVQPTVADDLYSMIPESVRAAAERKRAG